MERRKFERPVIEEINIAPNQAIAACAAKQVGWIHEWMGDDAVWKDYDDARTSTKELHGQIDEYVKPMYYYDLTVNGTHYYGWWKDLDKDGEIDGGEFTHQADSNPPWDAVIQSQISPQKS